MGEFSEGLFRGSLESRKIAPVLNSAAFSFWISASVSERKCFLISSCWILIGGAIC